jgi:hypothetical protein
MENPMPAIRFQKGVARTVDDKKPRQVRDRAGSGVRINASMHQSVILGETGGLVGSQFVIRRQPLLDLWVNILQFFLR